MIALGNIKRHVDLIQSNTLYIEQSIYQNLNEIAAKIHDQYRFTEQSVMFDFNPHTYQIHMQVQENIPQDGSVPGRYSQISVPRWFNLALKVPDFLATQNVNNLLALFHFSVGDCRVVPST
jgi:extradiol dioxygenase family protein